MRQVGAADSAFEICRNGVEYTLPYCKDSQRSVSIGRL